MFERIMGIITLKAPVYKAVAEDEKATKEAMMIVVAVSVLQGIVLGFLLPVSSGFMGAVSTILSGLVGWYVSAWLLATIAKAFGGKTDTNEMLRVTGYVYIFNLAVVFNLAAWISTSLLCVTSLLAIVILVLSLVGYVIGVREAAEFSTGNAVVTALIAAVGAFIVNLVGTMISGLF